MQEIDPAFEEKNAGFSKFSRFVQEAVGKGLLKVTKLDNGQLEVSGVKEAFPLPESEKRGGRGARRAEAEPTRTSGEHAAVAESTRSIPLGQIGRAGDRLTKDEAFDLVKRALSATVNGHASVSSRDLRRKAFELLGRDSESLSERFFSRILKDAQEAELVALKRRGRDYQVEPRQVEASSVSQRLNVAAAAQSPATATPTVATPAPASAAASAATAAPGSLRGGFGRRDARSGRPSLPPPDLLSIGVVEPVPIAPAPAVLAEVVAEEPAVAKTGRTRRGSRGGRGRAKAKSATPNATVAVAADAPAPRAKRARSRAKKVAEPAASAE
jgi:hypothetical protein